MYPVKSVLFRFNIEMLYKFDFCRLEVDFFSITKSIVS